MRRCLLFALLILVGCGSAETAGLRDLNGTQLFVREMGSGEPLVFVHGGPLLDHGYFLPHVAPLADEYRLVLYDQRLSGRSAAEVDSGGVSMEAFVGDIEALRVDLGVESVHLVAHSWGSHLAQRYAIAHPDRVKSLILISPMPASAVLWQQENAYVGQMATDGDVRDRDALMATPAFSRFEPGAIEEMMRISFRPQVQDLAVLDSLNLYFPADYAARSQQMGTLAASLSEFDIHADLAGYTGPVLLIYGEIEPGAGIGGPALVEAFPGAEIRTIQDAGHFSFAEQPVAFLEAVRGFLSAASD
jgi:proline iminopeptidase